MILYQIKIWVENVFLFMKRYRWEYLNVGL